MRRRTFLKATGITAAGGLFAGCGRASEKLIPLLVPAEDGTAPGQAVTFASTCMQCPAGCGIHVRVVEGRAKKIEGNPEHPVNQGALCARGQAALQELYHPDRLPGPARRAGPRGSGGLSPVPWERALDEVGRRLAEIRSRDPGRILLITPPLSGSLGRLAAEFVRACGGARHLVVDPLGTECHERVQAEVWGRASP